MQSLEVSLAVRDIYMTLVGYGLRFSSFLTENTLLFPYKDQPLNAA